MKRVIPILLLSVLLVGCATPTQSQLPTVTVTSTPTPPPTPPPTETPTPTKDPNAPPEYSRFESGVYYLDKQTENGNTLTYTWNPERAIYERFYFTAPLWDNPGDYDLFQISVYVDHSIDGEAQLPTLIHRPNNDPPESQNFMEFFQDRLMSNMANAGMVPRNEINLRPMYDGSHVYHFDFENADGPQSWGIWGSNGLDTTDATTITVHIRGDFEQLKANMDTNGFSEAKSTHGYGPENEYMVKVTSDNGNLIVDIAPSLRPATAWTQKQIMEMIMFGPAAVMEQSPDLTSPTSAGELSLYVLNQGTYPLFEMGSPQ